MRSEVYEIAHDLSGAPGEVLLSWYAANPNGPTAWTIGCLEADDRRLFFYRWLHFTRSRAWIIGSVGRDIDPASYEFGSCLLGALQQAEAQFRAPGSDERPILVAPPSFAVPARSEFVTRAFLQFALDTFGGQDWEREFHAMVLHGPDFFAKAAHQTREAFEELKADPGADKGHLAFLWARHRHSAAFSEWEPVDLSPRPIDLDALLDWYRTITSEAYFMGGARDFPQMWAGAVYEARSRLLPRVRAAGTYVSFSDLNGFLRTFGHPVFPPSWTDASLCDILRVSADHL